MPPRPFFPTLGSLGDRFSGTQTHIAVITLYNIAYSRSHILEREYFHACSYNLYNRAQNTPYARF